MSYHLDKKEKKKKHILWSLGAIVFFVLFYFGLYAVSANIAHTIFRPVFFVGGKIGNAFSTLGSYFSFKRSLYYENQKLQEKIVDLEMQLLNHSVLIDENYALKDILNRKKENQDFILASILGRPNRSLYDVMLIDAGEKQGVLKGKRVFAYNEILVGYVAEVYENSSKVVLFSSSGEKIAVSIPFKEESKEENKNILTELVGRGGGNFEISLPRDFVLEKGRLATLPEISSFVVATAEKIISDPRDSFQKVIFSSPVNLNQIKFVQIEI